MGRARDNVVMDVAPETAIELWTELDRWPAFIDGFGQVVRADPDWPAVGSELVWRSGSAGRGEVTERVEALAADRFVTRVTEEALTGIQTVMAVAEDGASRVRLELDYELTKPGPLGPITDVLFVRRALRDALRRTLVRYASEAEARQQQP